MRIPPHIITQIWVFILGCIFGVAGSVFADSNLPFLETIGKFQSLAAGIIALFGAIITIVAIRKKDADEIKRKEKAAIFPMADALLDVCNFSKNGIASLVSLNIERPTFEKVPKESLESLKNITEWAEGRASNAAGVIGPKYQLCRTLSEGDIGTHKSDKRCRVIFSFAELQCLARRLMDYSTGRKKAEIIERSFDVFKGDNGQIKTGNVTRKEITGVMILINSELPDDELLTWYYNQDVKNYVIEKYEE